MKILIIVIVAISMCSCVGKKNDTNLSNGNEQLALNDLPSNSTINELGNDGLIHSSAKDFIDYLNEVINDNQSQFSINQDESIGRELLLYNSQGLSVVVVEMNDSFIIGSALIEDSVEDKFLSSYFHGQIENIITVWGSGLHSGGILQYDVDGLYEIYFNFDQAANQLKSIRVLGPL